MPELPEVEVVRAGLAAHVLGRRVIAAHVSHPRSVRAHVEGADGFRRALVGRTLADVRRRGKHLWFVLDGGDALLAHLGMSGQFRIGTPDEAPHRHTRACFDLDDGSQLRFVDQRMFGGLSIARGAADMPVPHVAPDPFDPAYDPQAALARLRARRQGVKRALLDQRLVSGVGNIYADEALWRTRLHFDTPARALSVPAASGLLAAAKQVMAESIAQGGTSFDELYVGVAGDPGYFSRSLAVYGREGLPCDRCGREIVRERFANRSSFRCPACQPLPAKVVAC